MNRFNHLCYHLGSSFLCLSMSCVLLWGFIHGLDGSLQFGRRGEELYVDNPVSFMVGMAVLLICGIWAGVTGIRQCYRAWRGQPAKR
jgi:hypothetical protein